VNDDRIVKKLRSETSKCIVTVPAAVAAALLTMSVGREVV
jgi:hypothetical protein